ncbi:YbaB/EbfC family nucleoid-associated protein [Amycolatopsis sp. lyj-112]|uniref:YbaB/EbfC family nucleoid-associated protein n=1 Tax=Amycolatopsis sp. lyj-112 TaxID=2789288 RepID=UPI0039790668
MSEIAQNLASRIEAIDTAAAETRRRTETYQRMTVDLADVEGTATSPDRQVTVVAKADGTVKDIVFGDETRRAPSAALSATVLHTIAAARADAARLQAEIVRRELGDTELLDQVLDADERIFGDERPADPGPPPAAARQPRLEDERSYDDFSLFRGSPDA